MLASIIGAAAVTVGMTVAATSASASTPPPARVPLAGSAAAFTAHTRVIGGVAGSTRLTIQVWLKPRLAAAESYATEVATPGSSLFHHYLSPAGYTARFGATRAAAQKTESWLRGQGFTGVRADAQRAYVRATGPVSKIDAAFRVRLDQYAASAAVNAGRYALRANSGAVTIPVSLAGSVLGVTGLDNAAPSLPLERPSAKPDTRPATPGRAAAKRLIIPCSRYYGQHLVTGLPRHFGTASFPSEVCGYTGGQIRSVYGANTVNTGTGQTIALVELGLAPDMLLTLRDYAKVNGLPAPSARRYAELSLGQGSACGDDFFVEEQLDVESSYAMAPGASQLVVGGDSCNNGDYGLQGLFDADEAILDGPGGHPLATVASNSWEGGVEAQPPFLTDIEHAYLLQAAAEGVGMYFSAGDGSGVETPSSDPFAVAVGGTTLGIGHAGQRLFETGWSTAESMLNGRSWLLLGEQGASGGGPSLIWSQPAYQTPVVPAALATAAGDRGGAIRSVPDISADADPFTGFAVGLLSPANNGALVYGESDIGGTSLSSPLVAGMVTAAQQGQAEPFGFINPLLYRLAGTGAVYDTLPLTGSSPALWRGMACGTFVCGAVTLATFDDQSPAMFGYTGQVTLAGYDNMTGIGTPNGQQFITALRGLGSGPG
jgi:subtilase family serine protease